MVDPSRYNLVRLRVWRVLCGVAGGGAVAVLAVIEAPVWSVVVAAVAAVALVLLFSRWVTVAKELESIDDLRIAKEPIFDRPTVNARRREMAVALDAEPLDDQTVADIDTPLLHRRANACLSLVGEETFYAMLSSVPTAAMRVRRAAAMDIIAADEAVRLWLLRQLHLLGRERPRSAVEMLFGSLPPRDNRLPFYLIQSSATGVLLLLLILGATWTLVPLALLASVNIFLYMGANRLVNIQVSRFAHLFEVLSAAKRLRQVPAFDVLSSGIADHDDRRTAAVARLARFLSIQPTGSGDILELLLQWPKVLFLLDALVYDRLLTLVERRRDSLRAAYTFVGTLDGLQALAWYRKGLLQSCRADVAGRGIEADGLYNPLLEKPVANSLAVSSPGLILTGANMAGKSTLLRAVVLNVVLALGFGFACSARFSTEEFRVFTLIRKADSLERGESFYFFEAERIHTMLEHTADERPLLLAVDEFFAGTNSVERVAAATAVLSFLARHGCTTVAATHDSEVADHLNGTYALAYFDSELEAGRISFDYRLKPGIIQSTNGIALLESVGYPEDVVRFARRIASAGRTNTRSFGEDGG
jgi:hypothetical protein